MAKFTFSNDTKLDINGELFELDSTDIALLKRIEDFAKTAPDQADILANKENFVQAMEHAIKYALDFIEDMLGEGACERIFKEEPVSLNKAMSVINYIFAEIGQARTETLGQYSANRAVRRKADPKKK